MSYVQESSYIAGGNVKMMKLQVEYFYRQKIRIKMKWTTKTILKDNPMEDNDWLGVWNNGGNESKLGKP